MNVNIKRLDKELPLPLYETQGSVGFDILTREDTTIEPQSLGLIPGNVIVETPEGHMLLLALRSSTPRKKGLLKPHGIGVIDNDYCGEGDELKVQVFNFTKEPVTIKRGEKIAQGLFLPITRGNFTEVDSMNHADRGGFGSTDKKYCID